MNGDFSESSLSDASFQFELVPLLLWSHKSPEEKGHKEVNHQGGQQQLLSHVHDHGSVSRNTQAPHDHRKLVILEELWKTDNILVTEIGERGLQEYLRYILMPSSNSSTSGGELTCRCNWELRDDNGFRYLMEILQANMIHFLKRRYFDLERCRCQTNGDHVQYQAQHNQHRENTRRSTIVEDFNTIFDKSSSTRYFADREHIAMHCFRRLRPRQDGETKPRGDWGLSFETIQRALVRLHWRAGIYIPKDTRPPPVAKRDKTTIPEEDTNAYWIDLWWLCSSILVWILEPCQERMRAMAAPSQNSPLEDHCVCYRNQRSLEHTEDDRTGFFKQSTRVLKIPLDLIRVEVRKVGLFYDKVLLHDGSWSEEIDENYVCSLSDVDDDDESDGYNDVLNDDPQDISLKMPIKNDGIYREWSGIIGGEDEKEQQQGENPSQIIFVKDFTHPTFHGIIGEAAEI